MIEAKFNYDHEPLFIIISSPSGAGKTTLCKALLEKYDNIKLSISVTTRPKRNNEIDGVDYFFISEEEFQVLIKNNELIEYAKVFDHYYGTPKPMIDNNLNAGKDILFDIDWQGAKKMREYDSQNLVSIFILPPSIQELRNRLEKRAQDNIDTIRKRMDKAKTEIQHYQEYDYVIVNYDIMDSVATIENILHVERLKRKRLKDLDKFVHDMLEDKVL